MRGVARAAALGAALVWAVGGRGAEIVCATCHPKEAARYAKTPMGQSLVNAEPLAAGHIAREGSPAEIAVEQREGRMVHRLTEGGLTAEYAMKYQIGGGLMGRTYLVEIGGELFESPASWFNGYGWDLSPGYPAKQPIDFDRPVEEPCLFCHTGETRFRGGDGRRLETAKLTAITCERCHGPGTEHMRRPSVRNIVNPAKLTGSARDSVCEQCHLEGANRTLNPGKNWSDFHAGRATEDAFGTYVVQGSGKAEVIAVSQVEQLAQSHCARATSGKLWCATCHDPHGEKAADRRAEVKAACVICHATLSFAHPMGQPAAIQECTSCHMPSNATTNIPHAAHTDHRILRRPAAVDMANAEGEMASKGERARAWREPAADAALRDLALAEVVIGFAKHLPQIGADGVMNLESLPEAEKENDAAAASALEGLAMQRGDSAGATEWGKRAVTLEPESAKAAMNFGMVLKRAGNAGEAERELTRAIDLDAGLKQAYIELATLYASQGDLDKARETVDRFLKWNPQDIQFRLQRGRLPEK